MKKVRRLSLNDLPDELLILIFSRLIDLKCLCLCSLVSPRFSSLVLQQVHSVYYVAVPRRITATTTTHATDSLAYKILSSFRNGIFEKHLKSLFPFLATKPPPFHSPISAFYFISKFKSIRSLHLVLPPSPHNRNPNPNDHSLSRWTVKLGPTMDTFVFLSTSSIRGGREFDFDEQEQEEDPLLINELMKQAFDCSKYANIWHLLLRCLIINHDLLQNITITDTENQGSISLRDSKVVEMRNWLSLPCQTIMPELDRVSHSKFPVNVQQYHVPMLKLPVSRKVMVGATLVLIEMVYLRHEHRDWGVDASAIAPLFSQQGDNAFAEAVVEMIASHNIRMQIAL